jgi:hypothetical protein
MTIDRGGEALEQSPWRFPFCLYSGGIPHPIRGVTARELNPPFDHNDWKVVDVAAQRGAFRTKLVSRPSGDGQFVEIMLDSSREFLPISWVLTDGQQISSELHIDYTEGAEPHLRSWRLRAYDGDTLLRQHEFKVLQFERNPVFSADEFVLKPIEGMIVEHWTRQGQKYSVSGGHLVADTNYRLNELIVAQTQGRYMFVGVFGIVVFVTVALLARVAWKRGWLKRPLGG